MENLTSTMILVWFIKILSFTILMLTIYATVTVFKGIWFRFWASRHMDDRQKRELYVKNRYDIKWTSCMVVICLLSFVKDRMIGLNDQSWWNLFCAFLFGLLLWGSYGTLNIEKKRLKRKNDFGI
ncbi:MAG: hypothetical protein Q8Q90_01785 [bacterium]|nr:hypothetical protein [bacterium]